MREGRGKRMSQTDTWGKSLKWILFSANLIVQIGCMVVFGVGIWTVVDKSFINALLRNNLFMSSAYILIVSGISVIIITCFGIYGALKESKCALLSYFVFLLLFFIVLLVGGILSFVFRNQVASSLRPELVVTLRDYDPAQPNTLVTLAWDKTQARLNCCGIALDTGSPPWNAWKTNSKINSGFADNKVPWSCCAHDTLGRVTECDSKNPVVVDEIYQNDCFDSGLSFVSDHSSILATLSIIVATIMTSGMILSITFYAFIY